MSIADPMKIDVHSHLIEEIFFDALIEALDLSDDQKGKIFSGNATRLFAKRLALAHVS